MKADKYYHLFVEAGMIEKVRIWLDDNPPPENWESSKWGWAYTEMMVSSLEHAELNDAKERLVPAYNY